MKQVGEKMNKYLLIVGVFAFITLGNVCSLALNENPLNLIRSEVEHKTAADSIGISADHEGKIAIGFRDDSINIYNNNGTFVYSYTFDEPGSYTFSFDEENNLVIFSVRGYTRYYFNGKGDFIKAETFPTEDIGYNYYKESKNPFTLKINNAKYIIKQPWGYTKLIKIGADGYESVIYDSGSLYFSKVLIRLFIIIAIVAIVISVKKEYISERKKYLQQKQQ